MCFLINIVEHPFFNMKKVNKGTIKWINALDTVLVGKTLGKETGRTKIAAFDLVISNMVLYQLKNLNLFIIGWYIDND